VTDGNLPDAPRRLLDLEVHEVDDGYVIYNAPQSRVHYLNATAALVFELCNGQRSQAAIASLLAQASGQADPPTEQVIESLRLLQSEGLVA
jgi:hypothetical protein